jgi:hypothetical protein
MTTIRAILFGDLDTVTAAQQLDEAAQRLASAGGVPNRREVAPAAIARAALTRVSELLDIEVSDVLVGAWRTRSALIKAAKETRKKPGVHQQVTIRSYAFPWDFGVDFDVNLSGKKIGTISFLAGVEIDVVGLAVVVHNGSIVGVVSGEVKVGASLRIGSRTAVPVSLPLAQAERKLPLSAELTLPAGGLALID